MTKGSVANPPQSLGNRFNFARYQRVLQVTFLEARWLGFGLIIWSLVLSGCEKESVRVEKAQRRQLAHELQNHSYAAAAPIARQLLQRKPHDERIWKQLLHAQLGLHDLEGAKQSLERWRTAVPKHSIRLEEFQGDIARDEKNHPAALAAWEKVIQTQPNNIRVRKKIAMLHQSLQHWAEAEAAWNEAMKLKETSAERLNRAICRRRLHRWNEAFEDYRRAVELGPDDPEVHRWSKVFDGLQTNKQQLGEFDAKLAVLPDEIGLLSDRALLFLRSEDPEMALEDAQHAARLAPWALRPKLFQGIALIRLGRTKQADALGVRRPISLQSLTPEFLESASRLDLAIAVERSNSEHFIARSWQLNEIGQPKLAAQDAEAAVRLDPRSAGALTELAYALTKLGRAEEAYDKVRQATTFDPNSAPAWQYRGELEMARGDYLTAVDSLTHAAGIHQSVAVLQKRAECYQRLGLNGRAEEDHRTVQRLMATSVQ
ncbi:MAG TPA: tetratricopeptide repeat protein [Chthoniobacterales bacterium]|nr:tetratricopeptide repeat protein [Chthoniobacterales bacterium]